jgi:hypothetical protein
MPENFYRHGDSFGAASYKDCAFSALIHDKESSLFVFCSPLENLRIFSAPSTQIFPQGKSNNARIPKDMDK